MSSPIRKWVRFPLRLEASPWNNSTDAMMFKLPLFPTSSWLSSNSLKVDSLLAKQAAQEMVAVLGDREELLAYDWRQLGNAFVTIQDRKKLVDNYHRSTEMSPQELISDSFAWIFPVQLTPMFPTENNPYYSMHYLHNLRLTLGENNVHWKYAQTDGRTSTWSPGDVIGGRVENRGMSPPIFVIVDGEYLTRKLCITQCDFMLEHALDRCEFASFNCQLAKLRPRMVDAPPPAYDKALPAELELTPKTATKYIPFQSPCITLITDGDAPRMNKDKARAQALNAAASRRRNKLCTACVLQSHERCQSTADRCGGPFRPEDVQEAVAQFETRVAPWLVDTLMMRGTRAPINKFQKLLPGLVGRRNDVQVVGPAEPGSTGGAWQYSAAGATSQTRVLIHVVMRFWESSYYGVDYKELCRILGRRPIATWKQFYASYPGMREMTDEVKIGLIRFVERSYWRGDDYLPGFHLDKDTFAATLQSGGGWRGWTTIGLHRAPYQQGALDRLLPEYRKKENSALVRLYSAVPERILRHPLRVLNEVRKEGVDNVVAAYAQRSGRCV